MMIFWCRCESKSIYSSKSSKTIVSFYMWTSSCLGLVMMRLAVRLQAKSEPQNVRRRTCSTQADYLAKVCLLARTQDRNNWTQGERIETLLCLPNKKTNKQILAKNQFPGLTTSHQVQEFLCIFKRHVLCEMEPAEQFARWAYGVRALKSIS